MAKAMNFIKTSSSEIANRLLEEGYRCVNANGESYMFLNCKKMHFTEEELKKIIYTNRLEF